ncbi:MAG: hypothetical protein V5A43_08525 [Haloarculaceae archaeon]
MLRDRLAARGLPYGILDSEEFSRDTYERIYDRAQDSSANWPLAATFYKSEFLGPFEELDDVVVVLVWCDLEACLERNRRREDPIEEFAVHIVRREFERPEAYPVTHVTETSPAEPGDEVLARIDSDWKLS